MQSSNPANGAGSPPAEVPAQALAPSHAPRVFISYTHESPAHKAWVASLATDLRRQGVDALLDQWETRLGTDVTLYMERGIRESDRVLLICTPVFARKANEGEGGVGYERLVVTGELAKDIATEKFICVLRAGDRDTAIPTFAQSRIFVDFRNDDEYRASFETLLRDIHNAPVQARPTLGTNPFTREVPSDSPPLPRITTSDQDTPADLINRATEVLRKHDLLGWKRLVRAVRRNYDDRLAKWRDSLSELPTERDEWLTLVHEALDIAAPHFVLALTALESQLPEVANQQGLLHDLISPDGWTRSGDARIVDTPEVLAMSYHYLLGAYLLDNDRHADAISLLMTPMPHGEVDNAPTPVWRHPELIGFTRAITGNCVHSWDFLSTCYAKHDWLTEFFKSESHFVRALCAYQLAAGLLEMSAYAGTGGTTAGITDRYFRLEVPPTFIYGSRDPQAVPAVVLHAVANGSALDLFAKEYATTVETMLLLWPHWFQAMVRWYVDAGMYRVPPRIRAAPPLLAGRGFVAFDSL